MHERSVTKASRKDPRFRQPLGEVRVHGAELQVVGGPLPPEGSRRVRWAPRRPDLVTGMDRGSRRRAVWAQRSTHSWTCEGWAGSWKTSTRPARPVVASIRCAGPVVDGRRDRRDRRAVCVQPGGHVSRRSLVVGVDGSTGSDAAVRWAAGEAAARGLLLRIVHAAAGSATGPPVLGAAGPVAPHWERSAVRATEDAAALARRHQPAVPIETSLLAGEQPATVLARAG